MDFSHHETNPIQVLWHTGRPSSQARRTPRRHNSRARFCHLPVTTHSFSLYGRSRAFVVVRVGSKYSYNALCCGGGRGRSLEVEGVNAWVVSQPCRQLLRELHAREGASQWCSESRQPPLPPPPVWMAAVKLTHLILRHTQTPFPVIIGR